MFILVLVEGLLENGDANIFLSGNVMFRYRFYKSWKEGVLRLNIQ